MSTPELLTKSCERCGTMLVIDRAPFQVCSTRTGFRVATVWDNHSAANRAARAAGWQVQAESCGGDLCPECRAKREEEVGDE